MLAPGVSVSEGAFTAMLAAERHGHELRVETLNAVLLDSTMSAADYLAFNLHYAEIRSTVEVPIVCDLNASPGEEPQ